MRVDAVLSLVFLAAAVCLAVYPAVPCFVLFYFESIEGLTEHCAVQYNHVDHWRITALLKRTL